MELNMENRLCLNKKKVYELPNEVLIGEYRKKVNQIPKFEPNLCINRWGISRFCSIGYKFERYFQIWVKTENKDLISFIKTYDFKSTIKSIGSPRLTLYEFKKILLEEFY